MAMQMTDRRIWAVVLVISLCWGTSPVVVRIALREGLGPFTIGAAGSLIAAFGVLIMMAVLRRPNLIGRNELRVGAVLSVLSVLIPSQTRNLALQHASAGFVILVNVLIPIVTVVFAHFMLSDERIRLSTVVGLLLGLAGAGVLVLGGDSGIAEGGNPRLAGLFSMIRITSIGLASVFAKRYSGQYSVLGVTGVQLGLGAAGLTVSSVLVEGIPDALTRVGGLSLLYVGTVGSLVPLGLYYFLIRHVTVTYSTVISYIIPLVAVFTGVVVLDEQLQPGIVLGGALVVAAVVTKDLLRTREAGRQATRSEEDR